MSEKKENRLREFLSEKPVWVWLLVYLALTGILFGLFNLILYLLGIVPWIGVMVLVGTGLLWGMIQYSRFHKKGQTEENTEIT